MFISNQEENYSHNDIAFHIHYTNRNLISILLSNVDKDIKQQGLLYCI